MNTNYSIEERWDGLVSKVAFHKLGHQIDEKTIIATIS